MSLCMLYFGLKRRRESRLRFQSPFETEIKHTQRHASLYHCILHHSTLCVYTPSETPICPNIVLTDKFTHKHVHWTQWDIKKWIPCLGPCGQLGRFPCKARSV